MHITDPIADMLTRIRNANSAKHDTVDIPASNMKKAIAQILLDEGYIEKFETLEGNTQGLIRITLKYSGRKPIEIDWTRFGQLYGEWKSKNITGRDFMRRMGLSANTFYRRVREYETTHGITEPTSA